MAMDTTTSIHRFRRAAKERVSTVIHTLDTKYIYGVVPLLNTIVFILEMAVIGIIARRFDSYFDSRPVMTMMATNCILNGIADTVAQTVTAVRRRNVQLNDPDNESHKLEKLAYDELNQLPHYGEELIPDSADLPPPFDFQRLTRFMAYGMLMAPFQFKWFQFLGRAFPITKSSATVPAIKRVAMDQFCFAPVGLLAFFSYMTVTEGGGRKDIMKKLDHVYFPTLKANFILWPAVQLLNFRVMPLQFQLPFASSIGILWGTYLSLTNSSD